MKNTAIVFILITTLSANAQQIKSSHLDSLIWHEINKYRIRLSIAPVKIYNNENLRKRSYQLTCLNANRSVNDFDHTQGDSVFVGYNTECIFNLQIKGTSANQYTKDNINEARLNELAKIVVNAWIKSPNHNYLIRSAMVKESTVTSIMESNTNYFKLTVSYHDILKT